MKISIHSVKWSVLGHFVICALAFQASVLQSKAQIITLAHNNSVAQINTGSQAGVFNWNVDGVNQLAQNWFWYRVGNAGAEQSIDTISAPSLTQPNARTCYASYNNGAYGVEVDFQLTGYSAGSGVSDLQQTISITNSTFIPLDFHLFQYVDLDLLGTPGGDTVQLGRNLQGLFNEAFQSEGSLGIAGAVGNPGANHGEAGFFNATLVKLNDATPDTLSDNAGPVGPGDVTWALEWDLAIPAGGSLGFAADLHDPIQVPEPSTYAMLASGASLIGFRFLRRKCS